MFRNSKNNTISKVLSIIILSVSTLGIHAQSIYNQPEKLKEVINEKDNSFWEAYNQCNVDKMMSFLSEDFEFYHDKGGLTKGLEAFRKDLSEGLCANGPQLKRVVKEGTVEIFPMNDIGAIIRGEHYFYVGEKADGLAKFTHVWSFKNNEWKMSRVLSFDHQPVPYENKKEAIQVSDDLLNSYAGKYQAPQSGEVIITKKGKSLEMNAGPMQLILKAQSKTMFFHEESSLTFEFVIDQSGSVSKVIIRENGNIVEEAQRND